MSAGRMAGDMNLAGIAAKTAGVTVNPADTAPNLRDHLGQSNAWKICKIERNKVRARPYEGLRGKGAVAFAK